MKTHNSGFSLVEAMLAITLVLIILLPMLQHFASGIAYDQYLTDRMKSLQIAKSRIEGLRASGLTSLAPTAGSVYPSYESYASVEGIANFSSTVDILNRTGSLFDVTVRVDWTRGKGTGSTTLQTQVCEP